MRDQDRVSTHHDLPQGVLQIDAEIAEHEPSEYALQVTEIYEQLMRVYEPSIRAYQSSLPGQSVNGYSISTHR